MKRSRKTRKRTRKKATKKHTSSRQTMPEQQERKGASHYHPELYQLVTRHFRFCCRLDLAMKLTHGGVFLALLLSMASLKTSIICLGVLVALRTLLQLLKSAAKQFWKGGVPKSTTFRLKKLPPHEVQLGKFDLTTVYYWITECCKKLSMPVPTKLVVHESKYSNAFAWQQRFLFFMKQNEVHILSSLFDILNAEELQAVLCHELEHLRSHFPLVSPLIQLSLLLFSRFSSYPSYRWCLEYLADYAAVDIVGVAPMTNSLIKLHHLGHLIQEIWKGLQEALRDSQVSAEDIQELNIILEHALPIDLKSEQEVTQAIEQIVDQYFTERTGKISRELGDDTPGDTCASVRPAAQLFPKNTG